MILPIQQIKQTNYISRENSKKVQTTKLLNTPAQDMFEKSATSFKGVKLPSGTYPINDVRYAKRLAKMGNEWKKDLVEHEYIKNKHSHMILFANGYGKIARAADRLIIDSATLGVGELFYRARNLNDKRKAKNTVLYLNKIVADVKGRKFKEDAAMLAKREQAGIRMLEFEKQLNDVKEGQMKPELVDLIQRQREGRLVSMPNCVMLGHRDDTVNNSIIYWTKQRANANVKMVDVQKEEILDVLEEAESAYQETGDWNLIHAINMDKLIDRTKSPNSTVESMKDIMSATAEDYHTTLIFSSTNPDKLDSIALQPHRVKKIDTSGIKTPLEMHLEDAMTRIRDPKAQEETPLSVLNDILFVANEDRSVYIDWDNSLSNSINDSVRDHLKEKFLKDDRENGVELFNIFSKVAKNLV